MQISKSMFSIFLLCQAFGTLEAVEMGMMRSMAKVVSADGTVLDESSKILPNGDVVDSSLIERRSASADDMLAEIQSLVKSKDKGNRDGIIEIQNLAKQLVQDVKDDRDKEAAKVPINLERINKCNSDSTSEQQTIKSTFEQTTDSRRSTHASCREEEKNKESHKNGRCGELDTFLEAIKTRATKPEGRDAAVKWVEGESAYWCPKGPTVTGLDEACKKAEKEHRDHKADCDKKQGSFESGFCEWRTALLDECSDLGTCYQDAVGTYNKHVAITKDLVTKLKTEYKSLKKILCYVDVWMNDDNTSTVDADKYAKCHDDDPTDEANKALDIDYGKVPAKVECNTAPVQTYPGTQEFPTTEYSAFSKYAIEPIACVGATTAEATTTTAEPVTTTTAEPMTTMQEIDGQWKILHACTHCGHRGSAWKSNTMTAESCQEKCHADGKSLLIYNHVYYNCRCYDRADCVEDNRVSTYSPSCTHNIYGK
jgi:hypothetical protein